MELSAKQRAALELICDTFAPGDGLALPSATQLGVPDVMLRMLGRDPNEAAGKQLATLLGIWDTPLLGLLAGAGPRPFSRRSPAEREQLLLKLGASRLGVKRALFQALKQGSLLSYYVTPGPDGFNPLWKEMGYPGPPGQLAAAPRPALDPLRCTAPTTLDCDVVVVGSGAGGGTAGTARVPSYLHSRSPTARLGVRMSGGRICWIRTSRPGSVCSRTAMALGGSRLLTVNCPFAPSPPFSSTCRRMFTTASLAGGTCPSHGRPWQLSARSLCSWLPTGCARV